MWISTVAPGAADKGHAPVVQLLLEAGAQKDLQEKGGGLQL